jgi:hypothetical protein
MKKISLVSAIFCVLLLLITVDNSNAQGKSNKKIKTSYKKETGPPPWAPAHGYRAKTRYVYFQDHNCYYDNNRGVYIHLKTGNWEVSANIPDLLKNVDLSVAIKIDLDLDADNPQKFNAEHRKKYSKG